MQIRFAALSREQRRALKAQVLKVLAGVVGGSSSQSQVFDLDGVPSSMTLGPTSAGYLRMSCRISLPLDMRVGYLAGGFGTHDVKEAMMLHIAAVPNIGDATKGTLTSNDFDFVAVVRESRKVGFYAFDRDYDDMLNSDEFLRAATALLTPPLVGPDAIEAFHRLDRDGNGKLSSDEFFARAAHQA
jgi:hypothetical protein